MPGPTYSLPPSSPSGSPYGQPTGPREPVSPWAKPAPGASPGAPTNPTGPYPAPPAPAPAAPPSRRPRQGRGRFWGGFLLGFVLLGLASGVALALALGFGDVSLADITGNGTAWTPPTLAPTPTPEPGGPEVVEGGGSGRFQSGETVLNMTNSRVNVRRTPGHLGKEASDILAQLEPGDAVQILGETAQADNLTWWRVAYRGVEGWVAEATASGVQILGE